jgi:hypothetical protein
MPDQISISKTLSIRECGKDERWLQEQITADPSILGLGQLDVVRREKQQSSGGKLDFLLEDPLDGEMYEVEVMLGATDESHIIRALEYWDLERRSWPKRSHTAVLVAEKINRRFFNVIQLLSLTIPIVAIQVNIVEADGKRILHFTTILDAYQEPVAQAASNRQQSSESHWQKESPQTLVVVQVLRDTLPKDCPKVTIYYQKRSVSIMYRGYYVFRIKPEDQKFLVEFWLSANAKAAETVLETEGFPFGREQEKEEVHFSLKVDSAFVGSNSGIFSRLAKFAIEDIDL